MTEDKQAMNEKPLDKMTVTELRDIAKDIPEVTGVHAMKKDELLAIIKKDRGIEDTPKKKSGAPKAKVKVSAKELKTKIKALKLQHQEALAGDNKKMAAIYKRRMSRLKKKTRKAA